MNIRIATKDDLDVLFDFEQRLINHERPLDPSLKQNEKIHYYDLPGLIDSDMSEVFVAEIDDAIVGTGYGTIEENKSKYTEKYRGYIGFIFVKEEFRRRGVAEKIMGRLFEWFEEREVWETMLRVYEGNDGAIKAYEKLGFRKGLIEMKADLRSRQ